MAKAKKGGGGGKKGGGGKRPRAPLPQPPAPIGPQMGAGGYYQYTPTAESQINQPYQDVAAMGGITSLGDVLGRQAQQGQMGGIYGQTGAGAFGQYGNLQGWNQPIQQNIANEIMGIQQGRLDVDPAMLQQFDQQQRLLESQLRSQLGPDYATSSAGIEAMGRFQQGKQTALASANFNRLNQLLNQQQGGIQNLFGQGAQAGQLFGGTATDLFNQAMALRNQQLGGAGQLLGQAGQTQALYAGVPQTMGQFGQAMSGQAGAAVAAQDPYQRDRMAQLQAMYAPTAGDYAGQMLREQGNRLISSASAMGGGGGGAPQLSDQVAGQTGPSQMMYPSY